MTVIIKIEQDPLMPLPVDEAELVNRIDCQCRLCDVELSALLGQGVFFHEQCHHITCNSTEDDISLYLFVFSVSLSIHFNFNSPIVMPFN